VRKLIVLALLSFASQAAAVFAGESVESSKQVIAPTSPPPPEFFRSNEFDIGAFGTYATGVGSGTDSLHAWGGGLDLTYWFPWKYAGVRFQGTGASLNGGGGNNRNQKSGGQFVGDPDVTVVPGFPAVAVSGGDSGNSAAAAILTGDLMLRLPLDDFWPKVHLAPYIFAGFGDILLFGDENGGTASQTVTITNSPGVSKQETFTAQEVNSLHANYGSDRVLGHFGGGLEYRFTPHIGLFGEAALDVVNRSSNNLLQVNCGLRFAF
jgi:hypothetical protein